MPLGGVGGNVLQFIKTDVTQLRACSRESGQRMAKGRAYGVVEAVLHIAS